MDENIIIKKVLRTVKPDVVMDLDETSPVLEIGVSGTKLFRAMNRGGHVYRDLPQAYPAWPAMQAQMEAARSSVGPERTVKDTQARSTPCKFIALSLHE